MYQFGIKPVIPFRYLSQIEWPSHLVERAPVLIVVVCGIHLSSKVCEVVLVAQVLEYNEVLGIKQHVSPEANLEKKMLCVMTLSLMLL
jgi:hypothetical protein